jgi:hypothetical protein
MAALGTAAAPAQESAARSLSLGELLMKPLPKMAEVANFPSALSNASQPPISKEAEAPKPQRVVVTPDGLISALQGKLQQAAEKAVQTAITRQVTDVVRQALGSIENARQSSVREVQELFPQQVEAMKLYLKEETVRETAAQWKEHREMNRSHTEEMVQRLEKQVAELRRELVNAQEFSGKLSQELEPYIHSRLNEAMAKATLEIENAAGRVLDRRYERLLENAQNVTQEALTKLDARSVEVQALAYSAMNSGLAAFQRQTELHANMALTEAKERVISALSTLDGESRAACDARREALEAEVARSAERSTEQFRKGMKAFLYSCLVAAVSAVDEHSKSTLDGLLKDNGKSFHEAGAELPNHVEEENVRGSDSDPLPH